MKKVAFAWILLLFLAVQSCPVPVLADSGTMSTDAYKVLVNITSDKTAQITEEISVDFLSPMHGIYRYIPYRGKTYEMIDGKEITTRYRNKISDFFVTGFSYEQYQESGNEVLKIGDAAQTLTGPQTYQFSYKNRLAKDPFDDRDTLYLDLVPTGWDTAIGTAEVTVNFPKPFDASGVEVFSGGGDAGNTQFAVDGNTIRIVTTAPLAYGDGITLRLTLPETYFQGELDYSWAYLIALAIMLACLLGLGLFWFRFGRDPKHVQTVELNPPEGVNPAEIGYIIDGVADKKDLVSLVLYFAHKGYLDIEPLDERQKDFILTKKQDLPTGSKIYEQTFFNGLFQGSLDGRVELSTLQETFYPTYTAAKSQLTSSFIHKKENRIFAMSSIAARAGAFLIVAIGLAGSFGFAAFATGATETAALALAALVPLFGAYGLSCYDFDKKYIRKRTTRLISIVISIALLMIAIGVLAGVLYWISGSIWLAAGSGLLALAGFPATRFMIRRTKKGAEALGKTLGFREFIRVAEVDRIKMLVEENPQYFYEILPYAYVMGLSRKWASKFENIAMEPPSWYHGTFENRPFTAMVMLGALNRCTEAVSASIVIPSSSGDGGGGGFSGGGGGFSGGGMGGGGGGGW